MVTVAIDDKIILSKYDNSYIENKVNNFFKKEFWVENQVVFYWINQQNEDVIWKKIEEINKKEKLGEINFISFEGWQLEWKKHLKNLFSN